MNLYLFHLSFIGCLTKFTFGDSSFLDAITQFESDSRPHAPTQIVWFMQVSRPASLGYAYELMMSRDIGTPFTRKLIDAHMIYAHPPAHMIYAHPPEACDLLTNPDVKGNIVLAERGECSFVEKAYNVEKSGAVALIVTDSSSTDGDAIVEMVRDKESHLEVNIPTAFLTGTDGRRFRKHYLYSIDDPVIVSLPYNLTNVEVHRVKRPPWHLW